MKYCPTCETRYDEDILRFCMKDGTPLLDEAEPNFIEMPSESLDVPQVEADDPSEVTVIRRNVPVPPPLPVEPEVEDFSISEEPNRPVSSQRIVVPTFEERQRQERARVAAQYHQPPRRSNTALVVFLTMIGTVFVLGIGAAGFWFLQRGGTTANNNNNNANQNANVGLNTSFDFNLNGNFSTPVANTNTDFNTNTSTPTPTPRPSATPTASPTATPDDEPDGNPTPLPSRSPIPTPTPIVIRPGSSPTPPAASTPRPTPRVTPRTIITPSTNRP